MTLDLTARKLALQLIAKYGRSIVLESVTAGTYDPATGETTPGVPTNTPTKGVIEDYEGTDITAGLALAGDKKVTIAASGVPSEPEPGKTLTISGKVYTIISCKAVSSGEQDALYIVQARLT